MTTVLALRIAAVLAAIQGLAHGALFITAKPRHGDAEVAVISAMKSGRFFAGGLSYWDNYFGYGLIAAAICFVEAVLFWQLAKLAATQPATVRPIVALFIAWNVLHALILTRYFKFPLPIAFDVIVAIALAVALFLARSSATR